MSTPAYFLVTELISRFGSDAVSSIDTRTHKFAVVVLGVVEGRFSTLDCAEATADHYLTELRDSFMRHEDSVMAAKVREFVHIKNTVNGIIYRCETTGFWEAEKRA